MACLFALFAAAFPRLALLIVWLFTPLVNRAFDTFIIPLLGIVFLPFTTLLCLLIHPRHRPDRVGLVLDSHRSLTRYGRVWRQRGCQSTAYAWVQ